MFSYEHVMMSSGQRSSLCHPSYFTNKNDEQRSAFFQEHQQKSRRFPVFPGGISNSRRFPVFPVFPGVVDTLWLRAPRILRILFSKDPTGRSLLSVPQSKFNTTSENKTDPQYPAEGGAKITGDPIQGVHSQGALGGLATCENSQEFSLGLQELHVTGDTTASMPSTSSQPPQKPPQRATPVVVGPPP